MRKQLKTELLNVFKTIYEAHKSLKKLIEKQNYEQATNLLADCQDTAVQIAEIVENNEENCGKTIDYFEEYSKLLFEISNSFSGEKVYGHIARKQLDNALLNFENSLKNDIPDTIEIAFFPYKASMWDSLESIWKAAENDSDCDAYVVPIPYYDRNPDASLGQVHYEGSEFPDYIPIINFENYNFEDRKPDIIYIHNPYDNNNLVTCVQPRFFSSELKKYTDCLVYVPYFVLNDDTPVKSIENFAITPAVFNADRVIVQSEKMRDLYIMALLSSGKCPLSKSELEEKILGIGSPKFDKISQAQAEEKKLPAEWEKLIFKPDGTRKKVIFYNTGISALLAFNEIWIEKIASVLDYFKENREENVLLWRPHPLIENTLKSMRPQLLQRYLEIKDGYLSDGFGIYDDSPDLDRAIAVSDAYYGDGSSIVELFKHLGKPVMIATPHLKGEK